MQYLLAALLLLPAYLVFSQMPDPVDYPQGYFRNPLDIPMSLSGNFGELRANHFHMGLDLKTEARQNLPVHAAADGYIARIKIEPFGFGRSIYINHPNGFTTVYAHLNDFYPELEKWVKQQQYQRQSWSVYLELPPTQFPVTRGMFIAYSGTTGGSQAPHLHFEIRRTIDDVNLNPLLFGFPLPDNTNPRILRLAVYDRMRSMYEQSPKMILVKPSGQAAYTSSPASITVASPLVSFGIAAFDTHSGSSNLNGIFSAELEMDGKPVIRFSMDSISYNDTRYLNAHVDYKTRASGGPWLQLLTELPGYVNAVYTQEPSNGVINIEDGKPHNIKITVKDVQGNRSVLRSAIRYVPAKVKLAAPPEGKMFYPLMLDGFETDSCEFFLGERCLYDSVHIAIRASAATSLLALSEVYTIGMPWIPMQENMLLRIRPNRLLTEEEKRQTVMQWFSGTKKEVAQVSWQADWASARFREFGSFQLLLDQEPPEIVPYGFKNGSDLSQASRLVFYVKDNLGTVTSVRAELDGNWLCFSNDKAKAFIYKFDEKFPRGRHTLKIVAIDAAGNEQVSSYELIR